MVVGNVDYRIGIDYYYEPATPYVGSIRIGITINSVVLLAKAKCSRQVRVGYAITMFGRYRPDARIHCHQTGY